MTNINNVRTAISAANDHFMAAFKSGDAAGLAALYTQDGQILPPNSDFLTGRQAIKGFWLGLMDMGIKEANLEIVEVEKYGDIAVEVSKFTLLGEDRHVINRGKYIIIWKKDQGRWKMHRDIFNTTMPAPA